MALNITPIAAGQTPETTHKLQPHQVAGAVSDKTVSDVVQLSTDARKRLDEMIQGQTIAEAYLRHVVEAAMQGPQESNTDQQQPKDDEASKKFKQALDNLSVDIGWLIDALGLSPVEADKLKNAIAVQGAAYTQSAPAMPELIVRAQASGSAVVFVSGLSFDMGKDGIDNVGVEQVSVTPVAPSLAQQINDPNAPKVIVMGDHEDGSVQAGAPRDPFRDPHSVASRLAATPSQELQGMLIVREHAPSPGLRRVRVDALMPI
ncbi:MAG: hypothetical protein ACM33T_01995 [Solirubrobacterales bacterium]